MQINTQYFYAAIVGAFVIAQGIFFHGTAHSQTLDLSDTGVQLDSIVALVNDGVVLTSELEDQTSMIVQRLVRRCMKIAQQGPGLAFRDRLPLGRPDRFVQLALAIGVAAVDRDGAADVGLVAVDRHAGVDQQELPSLESSRVLTVVQLQGVGACGDDRVERMSPAM